MSSLSVQISLVSLGISLVSLSISLGNFWLASIRRGSLRMTKPAIVFLGVDITPEVTPKVFLRTLLFSTAARGHVIEGMYIYVRYGGAKQAFSFWGYEETGKKLSPGSGLYVSPTGLAANHHFVLSVHENGYRFQPGAYDIDVIAEVVGRRKPVTLGTISIAVSDEHAAALSRQEGVLFERHADGDYEGRIRGR